MNSNVLCRSVVTWSVKLAFHDADTDADILAKKSRVSDVRMYRRVGQVGVESVSVSVSMSAPWNESFNVIYTVSG